MKYFLGNSCELIVENYKWLISYYSYFDKLAICYYNNSENYWMEIARQYTLQKLYMPIDKNKLNLGGECNVQTMSKKLKLKRL